MSTVGNNAALILAGIDGIGTSNADFGKRPGQHGQLM